MATKRVYKRSKKSQEKKSRKMRSKMRGGNCGCGAKNAFFSGGGCGCGPKIPFFSGGSPFGPASFENVPISAYYQFNPHTVATDPQMVANITDERLAASPLYNPLSTQLGGKKKRSKRMTKKMQKKLQKKMKGGNFASFLNGVNLNNALPNTTASLVGTSNIAPIAHLYNNNSYVSTLSPNLASINDFHSVYQPIV
jgi:hypothetical protein